MSNATFDRPDLRAFTGLGDLRLEVIGQRVGGDRSVLACNVVGEDRRCQQCGGEGVVRDTVVRRLAHLPYGWRPTIVHMSVRRYCCQACAYVWRHNMSAATDPRGKLSRAAVRWGTDGRGRSSCDDEALRPGPRRVLEDRQHRCPDRRSMSTDQ